MNQSDFAKLHGVSRKTITVWKSRGWLVMEGDEIDVDASNANIERYRKSPSTAETKPKLKKEKKQHVDESVDESPTQTAERLIREIGADMSFDEARRIKENFLALLTKLEYEKEDGQLIELSVAESILFTEFRGQRDAWMNWPSRIAPIMAADLGVPADRMTEVLIEHVHKHITGLGEPEFSTSET
ncbi:hypothetical protein [Xenorhabdus budapestensis]|uniref:DNA-directed RNA polymerase sigma-70 factor n=1 Tax=Xenorhabdus budapestensis TaxID=290110 RepID=A0A2D0ILK3_XENBU|nr:hypothetical protein [Xenorhabdus budapestensis]PHM22659.1 DNA-directed RNA polymerase sigma-70 factor [Xenorhabdus budapestensis]